jgi:hypothetical protein
MMMVQTVARAVMRRRFVPVIVGHRVMTNAHATFCMMGSRFFMCNYRRMKRARDKSDNKNQAGE